MKTYLVTDDIHLLLAKWADERDFQLPSPAFFTRQTERLVSGLQLALSLTTNGHTRTTAHDEAVQVVMQPLDEVCAWANDVLRRQYPNAVVVNMDLAMATGMGRVGWNARNTHYGATRSVKLNNEGIWKRQGESPRYGQWALPEQVRTIAEVARTQYHTDAVVVVDDGHWKGESLQHCVTLLRRQGLRVLAACVGVLKTDLVDPNDTDNRLYSFPLYFFQKYTEAELFDWVCLRDFLPFVPNGGRQVDTFSHLDICAPYLYGFGDILDWASFGKLPAPEKSAIGFTRLALEVAEDLFGEIGRVSDKLVKNSDITRWPVFHGELLPRDWAVHTGPSLVETIRWLRQRVG